MIVRHCSFTDSFVHRLVALAASTLQNLDFYDCKAISKQSLITLSKCSLLSRLEFTGINSKLPSNLDLDDSILLLTQSNPNLRGFQWRNCPFLRDTSLICISSFCSLLDVLVLDGSANITDDGIRNLADAKPKLQIVSLKSCPRVSGAAFSILVEQTGAWWVKVDVSTNYWFQDEHLALIAQHCPNLLSLSIASVPKVTSMGLHRFATMSSQTSQLAATTIDGSSSRSKRKMLKELILWNNPHFSNDSLDRLKTVFGSGVVSVLATM